MTRLLFGFVALGTLVGQAGQAKVDYIITPLDVPGSTSTALRGSNDFGPIVGYYCNAGGDHAFLYSGGQFTTIAVPDAT